MLLVFPAYKKASLQLAWFRSYTINLLQRKDTFYPMNEKS